MTISEVSKKTGIPVHTLRYYDKEGLIPSIERTKNGIRDFKDSDIEWLSLIMCLKASGMNIKRIKEFILLHMQGDKTLNKRLDILIEQKKTIEKQMNDLEKYMKKINNKIEYYVDIIKNKVK